MYKLIKGIIIVCLLLAACHISGCSKKEFFPNPDIEVTADTYNLIPSSATELPIITYTFKAINGVKCTLKSYSVTYYSYLHEEIPQLALTDIPINIPIAGADWSEGRDTEGESVTGEFQIYNARVRELFNVTQSDISPIIAKVTFKYEDINDNSGTFETSCILYKYDNTSSGSESDPDTGG